MQSYTSSEELSPNVSEQLKKLSQRSGIVGSDQEVLTALFPQESDKGKPCPQIGLHQDSLKLAYEQGRVLASLQPHWDWECESFDDRGQCVRRKDPRQNMLLLRERGLLAPAEERLMDAVGRLSAKGVKGGSTAFLINGRVLITTAHSVCKSKYKKGVPRRDWVDPQSWKSKDITFRPDLTPRKDSSSKFGFKFHRMGDAVKIDWENSYIGGSGPYSKDSTGKCNSRFLDEDKYDFAILVLKEDIFKKYNNIKGEDQKRTYSFVELATRKPYEFEPEDIRTVSFHGDKKGKYAFTEHLEKGKKASDSNDGTMITNYSEDTFKLTNNVVFGASGSPVSGCLDPNCEEAAVFGLTITDCVETGGKSSDPKYLRSRVKCGNGFLNLVENSEFREALREMKRAQFEKGDSKGEPIFSDIKPAYTNY